MEDIAKFKEPKDSEYLVSIEPSDKKQFLRLHNTGCMHGSWTMQ
jgi:hypothetical protein